MNTKRRTTGARGQKSGVKNQKSEYAPRSPLYSPGRSAPAAFGGLQPTAYSLQSAFTLVELLVVISIIAILLGIIVPSYFSIREKAKYTKAKVTVKNLETAFKGYMDHYRVWPSVFVDDTTTLEIGGDEGSPGGNLFKILQGESVGTDNPDKIAFYEFETTNSALDPWSDPNDLTKTTWQRYRVRVDRNYDNKIDDLYRTVLVWSYGADRTNGTGDDVKSWD